MKKRLKKKHALQSQVNFLMAENALLSNALKNQNKRIEKLEEVMSQNTQAINARFNDLEKKVADKLSKRSWFSR